MSQPQHHLRFWPFAAMGFALGFLGSLIEFGDQTGFHGTGFPVPVVLWDFRSGTTTLVDFPNPLGYVENPGLGLFAAAVFWLFTKGVVRAFASRITPDQPTES